MSEPTSDDVDAGSGIAGTGDSSSAPASTASAAAVSAADIEARIAAQKAAEGLDKETDHQNLKFYVADHPKWGRAAFAKEDIKAGTVLLVEEPVVEWPRDFQFSSAPVTAALETCNLDTWCIALPTMWALGEVSERAQTVVNDLFSPPLDDPSVARFRAAAEALLAALEEQGKNKTGVDLDMVHRFIILSLVNAHGQGEEGVAMYDVGSKIAHSCRPNCSYQSLGSTLVYRSIMDVQKDEPLNFSYLALDELVYSTHKRQEKMLEFRFFVCSCVRCGEPDISRTMRCPGCESGLCVRKCTPLQDPEDVQHARRELASQVTAEAANGDEAATPDKPTSPVVEAYTPWRCAACEKEFPDSALNLELEQRLSETLASYEGSTIYDLDVTIEELHAWLAEAENELGVYHWCYGLLHKYLSEWYDQDATNGENAGAPMHITDGGSGCASGARSIAHAERFLSFINYLGGKAALPGLHSRHAYFMAQICGKEAQKLMQFKKDYYEMSIDNMSYIWGDTDADIVEARAELQQLKDLGYN